VIGTRIGVAVAIVLALAALAIGVVAFTTSIRGDDSGPGRVVQTRVTNKLSGDPVSFPLDGFVMISDGKGGVLALYVYPPGFFGHARGCTVVWQASATVQTPDGTAGPGLFTDPCSGAHFDRTGALVDGPADRGLDRFPMTPAPDGFLVDTHELLCGPAPASRSAGAAATPTPESPAKCKRAADDVDLR
jgi:hypothetical protein